MSERNSECVSDMVWFAQALDSTVLTDSERKCVRRYMELTDKWSEEYRKMEYSEKELKQEPKGIGSFFKRLKLWKCIYTSNSKIKSYNKEIHDIECTQEYMVALIKAKQILISNNDGIKYR